MAVLDAQVVGPTDSTQALNSLSQSMKNMSDVFDQIDRMDLDRKRLEEQINQFDVQSHSKLVESMVNNDQYKGNLSQFAIEHPSLAKAFLNKVLRGKGVDEAHLQIIKAPQTPEQQRQLFDRLYEVTSQAVVDEQAQRVVQPAPAPQDPSPSPGPNDPNKKVIYPNPNPAPSQKAAAPVRDPKVRHLLDLTYDQYKAGAYPGNRPPSNGTAAPPQKPELVASQFKQFLTGQAKKLGVTDMLGEMPLSDEQIQTYVHWRNVGLGNDEAEEYAKNGVRNFDDRKRYKESANIKSMPDLPDAQSRTVALANDPYDQKFKQTSPSAKTFRQFLIAGGRKDVRPDGPEDALIRDNQGSYKRYLASVGTDRVPAGQLQVAGSTPQPPSEAPVPGVPKAVNTEATKAVQDAAAGVPMTPKGQKAYKIVVEARLKDSAREVAALTNAAMGDPQYMEKIRRSVSEVMSKPVDQMGFSDYSKLGPSGIALMTGGENLKKLSYENKDQVRQLQLQLQKLGLAKAQIEFAGEKLAWMLKKQEEDAKIEALKYKMPEEFKNAMDMENKLWSEVLSDKMSMDERKKITEDIEYGTGPLHTRLMTLRQIQAPFMKAYGLHLTPVQRNFGGGWFGLGSTSGESLQFSAGGLSGQGAPIDKSVGSTYAKMQMGQLTPTVTK